MVIGVVGIVVTTLGMGFGGSWVFLYPLPFFSSGEWSETATGIFSASVLLTGVSILTWCGAIIHTVVGPGLQSEKGVSQPLRRRARLRLPVAEAVRDRAARCPTR